MWFRMEYVWEVFTSGTTLIGPHHPLLYVKQGPGMWVSTYFIHLIEIMSMNNYSCTRI